MSSIIICSKCGKDITGIKSKCPSCGKTVTLSSKIDGSDLSDTPAEEKYSSSHGASFNPYDDDIKKTDYKTKTRKVRTDAGSFGWGLMGFCLPIVGIILYFVWKRDYPKTGKSVLEGAFIALAFYLGVIVFNAIIRYGVPLMYF